jgi:transposase
VHNGDSAVKAALSLERVKKAAAAGIGWPLPEGWDDRSIEKTLFGDRRPIERRQRTLPDFPAPHQQFQQHRHLTLQLAWEEYRQVLCDSSGQAAILFLTISSS